MVTCSYSDSFPTTGTRTLSKFNLVVSTNLEKYNFTFNETVKIRRRRFASSNNTAQIKPICLRTQLTLI